MANEAPSWADQWGAGGIGAMEGDDDTTINNENGIKKKKKGDSRSGLGKVKVVAVAGVQKVKIGTFMGIKWIKKQFQTKRIIP